MTIKKWECEDGYQVQSDILRRALATPTHSLDELVRLMRDTGQASVYIAGTRLDNDYCFGSSDVGLLLSVLPEGAAKAAVPGYHPGSAEVYVAIKGSLVMECLEGGRVVEKTVAAGQVLLLPAGQCHKVRYDDHCDAVSLIVKTNLIAKPSVVRCDACTYFEDISVCNLHQRWIAESRT